MDGSGPEGVVALDTASDQLLADRATDGDARAFAVLVRRYGRLLRSYATRVLGNPSASDDVVQDALVVAWQHLDELQDTAAVRSWLIRIVTRKALEHARRVRAQDPIDEVEPPADPGRGPDSLAVADALAGDLGRALAALPEMQRQVWTLRELGGYTYDEIAAELDLPPSTVRGALSRARARLITELDHWRRS